MKNLKIRLWFDPQNRESTDLRMMDLVMTIGDDVEIHEDDSDDELSQDSKGLFLFTFVSYVLSCPSQCYRTNWLRGQFWI